jgi:archaellum component FlaC
MKFFKYLIFLFLLISFNAKADWYLEILGQNYGVFETKDAACKANRDRVSSSFTYQVEGTNCKLYQNGSLYGQYQLIETASQCSAQYIYSKPISVPGWTNWNADQTTAYVTKIQNQTACYKGCKYKNPNMTAGSTSDEMKLMFGDGVKDASCPATATEAPETPYPDNVTPPTDGCKSGEAYCDKPPTGCPTGYTSGSFNGKQICVKNNPDPTKPNPNDPNNNPNDGGGKFDDSRIIAAINDSKTAITNSINNAVNSINSSISTINQSITAVANAVNGTTNAVNNNTAATNAVKSSVDGLHNTINAVTTAVNNNTNAVTSAVNANTSATNAVKASVDALNSTVSAVTSAVDNNTKAVNANGDKVTNAVKDNITATNAVKDAVSNLNSSINAVADSVNANGDKVSNSVNANGKNTVDAINSNGKNTVDAVNAGTEATKENGKKLDGINDGIKEGNGHLKDIKDYLKEGKDSEFPENGDTKVDIKTIDAGNFSETIFASSAQCPANKTLSMNFLGRRAFSYTFNFSEWCYYLGLLGNLILICAYIYASNIVLRS